MAEYKEIHGTKIRNYTTNPDNPITGEVWYNETDDVLKFQYPNTTTAGSFSTGVSLNQGRIAAQNGAGTQTAALVYGGLDEQAGTHLNQTEAYNGSSWTELNNLNTARNSGAAGGTQTSALLAGGYGPSSASESWNGTNWTNTPSLNTARTYLAGAMESGTAGIAFGGMPPPAGIANTELYNGSNWTEVNDLNTTRRSVAGIGSSTAGFCMGGYGPPGAVGNCESWNGTNWTEVNDQINVGGGAAFGTLASAVKVGDNSTANRTELWNGTNWSAGTNASVNVSNRYGLGTSSLGMVAAGEPPNEGVASVEHYEGPGQPIGVWASGVSINTARNSSASGGATSAAAVLGGGQASTGVVAVTELFNGSNWTEVNDMNTARNGMASNGTSTSCLGYMQDDPARSGKTESWNGTNWTEMNDLSQNVRQGGGLGADNTSALAYGGESPSVHQLATTELWNGTNWTEVNDLNTARLNATGSGIVTAGLAAGGRTVNPGTTDLAVTESWNGTNWTEVNDLNTARYLSGATKPVYDNVLVYGGYAAPNYKANTEEWNGASWVEVADLSTARQGGGSAGTTASALFISGYLNTYTAATEEWSGSSTATKTISTD